MSEWIANLVGNNVLATLIMSFFPLIELKGGIIFARSVGLGFFESFGLAYLGSTVAFFLIFFLLRPVLNLLKKIKWFNGFATKVEGYFDEKANKTLENQQKKGKKAASSLLIKQLAVFIFVAIPLPMTGVWTGTAIAVFLNLKFKDAVLPVTIGNLVAGGIMALLAQICIWICGPDMVMVESVLNGILYVLFALALILLVVFIIKVLTHKDKKVEESDKEQVEE
jgi:uncharacterized membrane protein